MECQSVAGPEAAPAGVAARVISASLLDVGWPGSLVREDHREVSPLAREGLSSVGTHLLSARLPSGLRLLPDPTPAISWAALARGCPLLVGVRGWEDNGVATFRRYIGVG